MPHHFPGLRPPVSLPGPFPFLPSPLGESLGAPLPPTSLPVWRDAPSRRDSALRGRPGEPLPGPRCSLLCPARRRSPGYPLCSRWDVCFGRRRATSWPFQPSFVAQPFIHPIRLVVFSCIDSVSGHPRRCTGFWGREEKILKKKKTVLASVQAH